MGDFSWDPQPAHPQSIHGHHSTHPVMVAVLAIFGPMLFALVIAGLYLATQPPESSAAAAPEPLATPVTYPELLLRHEVKNAAERLAVCNDGSPATYYYRPGKNADADKWVIFLEGGDACTNDEQCAERLAREPHRTGSLQYPEKMAAKGILSNNAQHNPDFADFAHVYVKSCSSDLWSGDTSRIVNGQTIEFRGANIITAVLEDLRDGTVINGPTIDSATQIVFAGSAGGGSGVARNLDRVASLLSWAEVKGVIDSAWIAQDELSASTHYNATLDESCIAANLDNLGVCASTPGTAPYLSTPYFVFMDQLDGVALKNLGITDPTDPAQREAAQTFQQTIKTNLSSLPAFSSAVGTHTALTTDAFTSQYVNGATYQEILGNWFFNRSALTNVIAE